MIHAGWFQRRKSAVQQEKIAVKYRFFKHLLNFKTLSKKGPFFTTTSAYLVVKNEENSCKIREVFFLLKHPICTSTSVQIYAKNDTKFFFFLRKHSSVLFAKKCLLATFREKEPPFKQSPRFYFSQTPIKVRNKCFVLLCEPY